MEDNQIWAKHDSFLWAVWFQIDVLRALDTCSHDELTPEGRFSAVTILRGLLTVLPHGHRHFQKSEQVETCWTKRFLLEARLVSVGSWSQIDVLHCFNFET